MRYFIRLSYGGTHFCGWQVQPGKRTVQGELNQCLSHLLREEVHVVGAGRTDTGVHASVMFAHVDVSKVIKQPEVLAKRMNRYLKADIAIQEIFAVKEDAHARFSATARSYVYHINRQKDPFKEGLSYYMAGQGTPMSGTPVSASSTGRSGATSGPASAATSALSSGQPVSRHNTPRSRKIRRMGSPPMAVP